MFGSCWLASDRQFQSQNHGVHGPSSPTIRGTEAALVGHNEGFHVDFGRSSGEAQIYIIDPAYPLRAFGTFA
jgi:hypothetical protein